ncbi:capsular biosynthesis protein [Burkholderia sp. GS2Y]|uniref:Capsular biosynthesis protein n=1 Tax=Burkholderia theae TaxID=3143496 RepID=A0ABU9WIW2_9BURK
MPLSWLELPVAHARFATFIDALNNHLSHHPDAQDLTAATRLMERVALLGATPARQVSRGDPVALPERGAAPRVLLIDQRLVSRGFGAYRERHAVHAFESMVNAAQRAHPNAEFWLARSGDAGAGRWLSELSAAALPARKRVGMDGALCDALRQVDHVYTVSASEGMHALLAGAALHVFGQPYYAGWGLSDDAVDLPRRTARPTLAALFEAVFVCMTEYPDPVTHGPGTLDAILDCLELQQAVQRRYADLRQIAGMRFQYWKRPFATPYLLAGGGALRWLRNAGQLAEAEYAVLWGGRNEHSLPANTPRIRIEDGFLHSAGLGSDMSAPHSQVLDRSGLYFDASRPSDLTAILNYARFDEGELQRAADLRRSLNECGVTKYNLGRRPTSWTPPTGRPVVLVIGQVADDASIRLGTRGIATADELLREVRARRPEAFVVYKPHPDVLSGNRRGVISAVDADLVDDKADVLSLIAVADEVHTLSSLAGFDALLRGKPVFTYGLPFYAGWGLTHDALAPLPWRTRTLTLDMLTAGALIRYPLYFDWTLRIYTTPEAVVAALAPGARRELDLIRGNPTRLPLKMFRWSRNVIRHVIWRYG